MNAEAHPHADELSYLMRSCASGDEAALRRIYDLQAPRLKALAMRITGTAASAEDVLHDVFIHVWQEAGRFDPARGPAGAWLTMLTRFRAIELTRRRGREHTGLDLPELADPAPDALAHAIGLSDQRRLADCMAGLPDLAQTVISRAFLHGLTYAQIAENLKMPLGTLKSLVRRSLRDLRGCME